MDNCFLCECEIEGLDDRENIGNNDCCKACYDELTNMIDKE